VGGHSDHLCASTYVRISPLAYVTVLRAVMSIRGW